MERATYPRVSARITCLCGPTAEVGAGRYHGAFESSGVGLDSATSLQCRLSDRTKWRSDYDRLLPTLRGGCLRRQELNLCAVRNRKFYVYVFHPEAKVRSLILLAAVVPNRYRRQPRPGRSLGASRLLRGH